MVLSLGVGVRREAEEEDREKWVGFDRFGLF
jgi:hypothetical protein